MQRSEASRLPRREHGKEHEKTARAPAYYLSLCQKKKKHVLAFDIIHTFTDQQAIVILANERVSDWEFNNNETNDSYVYVYMYINIYIYICTYEDKYITNI